MKLETNFSQLINARESIGAMIAQVNLKKISARDSPSFIDKLMDGEAIREIVSKEDGILIYEGKQVIIYINTPFEDEESLSQKLENKTRFHFSDCYTIDQMKSANRYERYVVTNNTDGWFHVFPYDREAKTHKKEEIKCELRPCQNCLKKLNYKNYKSSGQRQRSDIINNFSIKELFNDYSLNLEKLPVKSTSLNVQEYPRNWTKLSEEFRRKNNWTCDCCKAKLNNERQLIHVHHINGIKNDCALKNLRCLCLLCHAKQPHHDHMKVDIVARRKIEATRTTQNLTKDCSNC